MSRNGQLLDCFLHHMVSWNASYLSCVLNWLLQPVMCIAQLCTTEVKPQIRCHKQFHPNYSIAKSCCHVGHCRLVQLWQEFAGVRSYFLAWNGESNWPPASVAGCDGLGWQEGKRDRSWNYGFPRVHMDQGTSSHIAMDQNWWNIPFFTEHEHSFKNPSGPCNMVVCQAENASCSFVRLRPQPGNASPAPAFMAAFSDVGAICSEASCRRQVRALAVKGCLMLGW